MPARPVKRKRHTQDRDSSANVSDECAEFTAWAQDRGVEISNVTFKHIPGRGRGLVTTSHIKSGNRILFIPEKAMFKSTRIHHKPNSKVPASPQVQLAINLMAACKSQPSKLALWESTWPTAQDFEDSMPMCWPESAMDMLPPSVQQPLQRQQKDYERDLQTVTTLCDKNGWTVNDFRYYWMIVNSRSFHWKPEHGAGSMVMCPYVDLANHGPTGTTCRATQSPEGYEVWAERDLGKPFVYLFTFLLLCTVLSLSSCCHCVP